MKEIKEFNKLKTDFKKGVAYVYINNPPANALNAEMVMELSDCIEELNNNPDVNTIVVTGEGKFFAAGADINEFKTEFGNKDKGTNMANKAQATFDKIENLEKPVIAAINGACLGGGLELAMSCDLRIASDDAPLGQPELNLGLIPGFGGTQRLPRLTNKPKALEMILLGKNVKGEEAESIGLVNKVVAKDEVLSHAMEWAETLSVQKSSVSVKAALKSVNYGTKNSLQEGLAYEAKLFGNLFDTADMQEGVNAFVEKRSPSFENE